VARRRLPEVFIVVNIEILQFIRGKEAVRCSVRHITYCQVLVVRRQFPLQYPSISCRKYLESL